MCAMWSDRKKSKAFALMTLLDFGEAPVGDDPTLELAQPHLKPAEPLVGLLAELQWLLLVPVVC